MKKAVITVLAIVLIAALVALQKFAVLNKETVVVPANTNSAGSESSNSNSQTSVTPKSSAVYKDGQYTGKVTDAFYGEYQVKVIIANAKISDVQFLKSPNDARHSVEVSAMANPALKQEAIVSQSANVDTVTGATQTSIAFRDSLQSALDQAM